MRILSGKILSADRPFEGQGVSVYAGTGQPRYRRIRVVSGRLCPMRTAFSGDKTARIATEAGTGELELAATIPSDLLGASGNANLAIDVRHYRDDAENESEAPQIVSVDGSGDGETVLDGRATLITAETRSGGGVRLSWRYIRGRTAPARFRVSRLTGPTSPDDVTVAYRGQPGRYEASFSGLSASTYTFEITEENTAGTITNTLIASVSVTPVSAGPGAVTSISAEVR